jgi:TetR/AcrR family transcriptional regulator, regulator of cefoperazone and chloramphenicol sensitivity
MARTAPSDTRRKLLDAAAALFAERGFHRTTARDVAERADVNLAAANYHFGSKKALYLEVFREQFAAIRAELARRGAAVPARARLRRLRRAELEGLLAARIRTMAHLMIGPPPSVHSTLMQRELTDPSEALPTIVEEFMRPMKGEIVELLASLAPELDRDAVERAAHGVIGQLVFYRVARPALLEMLGRDELPRGTAEEVAEHVLRFSLGGLERIVREPKGGRRAR